ncbi:hypothetical protein CDE51_12350, partial [Pasteurella multocida]
MMPTRKSFVLEPVEEREEWCRITGKLQIEEPRPFVMPTRKSFVLEPVEEREEWCRITGKLQIEEPR